MVKLFNIVPHPANPVNPENAIEVFNLRKTFRVPNKKHLTLREKCLDIFKKNKYDIISPLNGISFEVKKGEFFGIVGRNGSGKTTLLRILAGIYRADQGSIIRVSGKIAPMLELGVGFNPEMTGRENVYLNGIILGLTKYEIQSSYNEIVKFADLGGFMEMQVKHYSSGMQVRLAFAIAMQVNAPILLLDEVLAVGDFVFQEKCFAMFNKYKKEKKTIVLVSHDAQAMHRFADKIMIIDSGKIAGIGDPDEMLHRYMG